MLPFVDSVMSEATGSNGHRNIFGIASMEPSQHHQQNGTPAQAQTNGHSQINENHQTNGNSQTNGNPQADVSPHTNGHHRLQTSHAGETDLTEPIAIIGLAFELPGGITTPRQFWDTISNGRNQASQVPEQRWKLDGFYREGCNTLGVHHVRQAHFLERDIATFDAPFFRITVNEAHAMDPQQRILLETSYRALENAGISIDQLSGSKTCAYIGTFTSDYSTIVKRDPQLGAMYFATGTGTAIMANRLSWFYNLKGPSAAIDTGCSASLLALHLACQSIYSGETDMGIVGGCNLILDPDTMLVLSDSGFLSPDGRSYAFDARANGYARGEGSGVVIVKRLSHAIRDGDNIRAVIRATGANQDGTTPGIAQPSFSAQKTLIQDTYRKAGLDMSRTQYFEAHGTGTPIGDPIEARAIREAFENVLKPGSPIYITALKPNIGHLENVSGVASLIKTVLSLERGVIPPIAGLTKLNPAIKQHEGIRFATEPTAFSRGQVRRASINSFGYGGTNVHTVLQDAESFLRERGLHARHCTTWPEHQHQQPDKSLSPRPWLLPLSAVDESGIQRLTTSIKQHIADQASDQWPDSIDDLVYTLTEKRTRFAWRSYSLLQPHEIPKPGCLQNVSKPQIHDTPPRIAFVFTGQGAQWAGMGQGLLVYVPFRLSIEDSDRYLRSLGSEWSLTEALSPERGISRLDQAKLSQPANTALQIAIVDLLRAWNVTPEAVVGHSSGEIAAAYSAGCLNKKTALKISYHRGIAADLAADLLGEPAGMLAIGISKRDAEVQIRKLFGESTAARVSVACINSQKSVTLSGYISDLELLKTAFENAGSFVRFVRTAVPYHSKFIDKVAPIYRALMQDLETDNEQQEKCLPYFSSTTAEQASPRELASAAYWVKNLTEPVRFESSLGQLLGASQRPRVRKLGDVRRPVINHQITHILEIGPHSALQGPIRDILQLSKLDGTVSYSATLKRNEDSHTRLLDVAGTLFAKGYPVDLLAANGLKDIQNTLRMITDLPGYPYNHSSRYWLESRLSERYRNRDHGYHELLGMPAQDTSQDEARWRQYINLNDHQWIADHNILGMVIYPAAGLLAMVLEATKQLADECKEIYRFGFDNVVIGQALVIPSDSNGVETQLNLRRRKEDSGTANLTVFEFVLRAHSGEDWLECCHGRVMIEYTIAVHETESWTTKTEALEKHRSLHAQMSGAIVADVNFEALYSQFEEIGLRYGPSFQALRHIQCGGSKEAVARLDPSHWKAHVAERDIADHIIHPATLDNILQLSMVALTRGGREKIPTMIPTRLSKLWITPIAPTKSSSKVLNIYAQAWKTGFRGAAANFSALSSDKDALFVEGSFELTAMLERSQDPDPSLGLCYAIDWKPDLDSIETRDLARLCHPELPEEALESHRKHTALIDDIKKQTVSHLSNFVGRVELFTGGREYLRNYIAFMGRAIQELGPEFIRCDDLSNHIKASIQDLPNLEPELELTVRIAENLDSILRGETDPLALLFSDDVLTRFYANSVSTPRLYGGLERFIDLLGHKIPTMRILEIGAGTGGASRHLLEILSRNGDSSGHGPRFSHYCYTDISPSFFEAARRQFASFGDRIEYKVLNIEQDPGEQGFCTEDYDIVLAANVLHATSNLGRTLSHVNRLLKPGGKLILFEATQPHALRTNFIFGLLPGWWLSSDNRRQNSPLLTQEGWDEQLRESGFSGLDVAVLDDEEARHQSISLLVSKKIPVQILKSGNNLPVTVIASQESPIQQEMIAKLRSMMPEVPDERFGVINLDDKTWKIPPQSICVFTYELEENCTWKMSERLLNQLKEVFATASGVIWLADSSGAHSDGLNGISIGLSRVYKTEHPELQFTHLQVELARGPDHVTSRLHHVLTNFSNPSGDESEDEYREINGILNVNRLVPYTHLDRHIRPASFANNTKREKLRSADKRHIKLTITEPGLLETFKFVDDPRATAPLQDDEVEVEIHATGLNFRDVLVALGQINDDFFGFECAGIVRKTGGAVSHLAVGDRVACLMQNTFATTGRCHAAAAVRLPHSLSMVAGAGLPVVAATAYYALVHVGRLNAGERVLIHSGAGGLGQAAIQIAQAKGAIVFTSVGTTQKKKFLMDRYAIPAEHIFSSRTLSFAASIERLTGGKGVDVVLNSLSGEALRASWRCLAPFGRFLEAGKKDILASAQLPMGMFSSNVSFSGIDLAHIIRDQPVLAGQLLGEVIDLAVAQKILPPTPLHTFPASKIEDAFRLMQSGKSIGKMVIEMHNDCLVPKAPVALKTWKFDSHAVYVIAGGLGGLGRNISRWMASRGARKLVLLGRRSQQSIEVQGLIQELSHQGVQVVTPSCDISDRRALSAVLAQCSHLGPIKGCLQLSMVIREAEFQDTSLADIQASLAPKVDGTLNLDALLPRNLDFFIMFSSISGINGNPGMAPYAMGNVFQDEFARWRVSHGLRATSVDLGIVSNAGYVAENPLFHTLNRIGYFGIDDTDIHALLAVYCDPYLPLPPPDRAQVVLGLETLAATRARGADGGPWYQRPLFRCVNALHLMRGGGSEAGVNGDVGTKDITAMLKAAQSEGEAVAAVLDGVVDKLVAILGLERQSDLTQQPLHSFGIDSMVAVEIRNWFRRFVGADVAVFEILGHTSVADLAAMAVSRSDIVRREEERD